MNELECERIPDITDYNVIWTSPSGNSMGSMPSGNRDIRLKLWVENNGGASLPLENRRMERKQPFAEDW